MPSAMPQRCWPRFMLERENRIGTNSRSPSITSCGNCGPALPTRGISGPTAKWWGFSSSARVFSAAIRLEVYWIRFLQSTRFKLFCGYPIDNFADDFSHSRVDAVLCAHTHLVSTGQDGNVKRAVAHALEEVAGPHAKLESLLDPASHPGRARVPLGEAAILGLPGSLLPEQHATSWDPLAVITRARSAFGLPD